MAEASPQPETSTANTQLSVSPPPNCAICLGNCINKCFSDSCMHQFCFKCLLEWSKVKAVCPLCKQPFNSIIHNVKSNNEYDEHFIEQANNSQEPAYRDFIDPQAYDFFVTPASRHFQFRTTFTVDPRGELAIQQLLSTHPLTTNSFHLSLPSVPNSYVPRTHLRRFQHDFSSTNFRRYIYDEDMWVHAMPDITGRFRDVSPQYFRENTAARTRLVPWLNRELNALLYENTQHVMHVCDQILSQLDRHHLTSRYFNQLIEEYLGSRTDHFIHEFYNFMRSPYDMIGYDRVVRYSHALRVRIESSDEEDEDSDVVIVGTQPRTELDPMVIEINSDSSHDSDVIIREPTPPVVVDLVDSESEHEKPILPLKIRLKRKRQNRERKSRRRDCSSSSSDSSSSSSSTDEESRNVIKSRKRYQKQKYYIVKNTDSDSDSENQSLNKLKKEWEDRKRKKAKKSRRKQKSKSAGARTVQQNREANETQTTHQKNSTSLVQSPIHDSTENSDEDMHNSTLEQSHIHDSTENSDEDMHNSTLEQSHIHDSTENSDEDMHNSTLEQSHIHDSTENSDEDMHNSTLEQSHIHDSTENSDEDMHNSSLEQSHIHDSTENSDEDMHNSTLEQSFTDNDEKNVENMHNSTLEQSFTDNDEKNVICKYENTQSDQSGSYTPPPRDNLPFAQTSELGFVMQNRGSANKCDDIYKSEVGNRTILSSKWEILEEYPGPSNTGRGLLCKEPVLNNWYSRPVVLNSDEDSD